MKIVWVFLALSCGVGMAIVLLVVMMVGKRDDHISMIRKQANCAHGVTYFSGGEKLCARCGKKIPRVPWREQEGV